MEELREELREEHMTEELDQFRIKGLNEALDITKEKDEKIREEVEKLRESIIKKIKNEEKDFDILDSFSMLSKVSLYLTQYYFDNEEQFNNEYKISRKLVTENILQSLGINSNDEEKNKNSVVTFNGVSDLENFSLRRILMISSQITEYAIWQLTLTRTFDKLSQEGLSEIGDTNGL